MKKLLPAVALVAFSAFSTVVIAHHGYTGFLTLAMRDSWALQMLLDLSISIGLFGLWMRKDAEARGINPWPYYPLLLTLGSIGALAYLVHRALREERRPGKVASGALAAR